MKKLCPVFLVMALALSVTFTLMFGMSSAVMEVDDWITINASNFPDPVFREYVRANWGYGDKLYDSVRFSVTDIGTTVPCLPEDTVSLVGIKYFPNIQIMECKSTQITSLDLSGMTRLRQLECTGNQYLESLDLHGCTMLRSVVCDFNSLSSINLKGCDILEYFLCEHNQLTSLNLSGYEYLLALDCKFNQLSSLNVEGCTSLNDLDCYGNQLTSLNVKGLNFQLLDCSFNQLTSLDLSGCKNILDLKCHYNQLSVLDLTDCTSLFSVICSNNQLANIDVSNASTDFYWLYCPDNHHAITAINGVFDLSTLPGFDVTKASNWKGGTVSDTILTVPASGDVRYTYNCGKGFSETFTLNVDVVDEPVLSDIKPEFMCNALREHNPVYHRAAFADQQEAGILHETHVDSFVLSNYDELKALYGGEPNWSVEWVGEHGGTTFNTGYIIDNEWTFGEGLSSGTLGIWIHDEPSEKCTIKLRVTCEWGGQEYSEIVTLEYHKVVFLSTPDLGLSNQIQGIHVNQAVGLALEAPGEAASYIAQCPWIWRDFQTECDCDWSWNGDSAFTITPHEAGIWPAKVWIRWGNLSIEKTVLLYVKDENGNVPGPKLAFTDSSDYYWTIHWIAFEDNEAFGLSHFNFLRFYEIADYNVVSTFKSGKPEWTTEWIGDSHGAEVGIELWDAERADALKKITLYSQPAEPCTIQFKLICSWDGERIESIITVVYEEGELPKGAEIPDTLNLKIHETSKSWIPFNPEAYSLNGANGFWLWCDGFNRSAWNEGDYFCITPYEAGTFSGTLYKHCRNVRIGKKITLYVADENGNVPAPKLAFTDPSCYDYTSLRAAFSDNDEISLTHEVWGCIDYEIQNYYVLKTIFEGKPQWSAELVGETYGASLSYHNWDWEGEDGVRVMYIDINNEPTETCTLHYKVSCAWGGQTITGVGTLNYVIPETMPEGLDIQNRYDGLKVGETFSFPVKALNNYSFGEHLHISFDRDYNCDNWWEWVDGQPTQFVRPYEAGILGANVRLRLENMSIEKYVLFYIADENGNVPAVAPDIDEEMHLEYYLMPEDTKGYNLGLASDAYDIEIRNLNMLRAQYGEDDFQVSFNQISGPSLNISSTNELRWENCLALILPGVENMREESDAVVDATVTYAGHSATTRLNFHFRKVVLPEIQFENDFTLQVGETYEATVSIQPADWADTYFLYYDFNDESNFEKWGDGDNQQTSFWFKPREAGWYSSGPHIHARNMFIRGDWFDFAVKDENGNVPELKLAFDDSNAYDWSINCAAFADNTEIGLVHREWLRNYIISGYETLKSVKTGLPVWSAELVGETYGATLDAYNWTWEGEDGVRGFDVNIRNQPAVPCTLHYTVTCTWDGDTITANGTVNFIDMDLPTGANIPDTVEMTVNQTATIPMSFIPANFGVSGGWDGISIWINGLDRDNWCDGHIQYITPYQAGTFFGYLGVCSGNVEVGKDVIFRVANEGEELPPLPTEKPDFRMSTNRYIIGMGRMSGLSAFEPLEHFLMELDTPNWEGIEDWNVYEGSFGWNDNSHHSFPWGTAEVGSWRLRIAVLDDNDQLITGWSDWQYFEAVPVDIDSLSTLRLPAVTEIEEEAFANSGTERVILPGTVQCIESRAFANCGSLQIVQIENSGDIFIADDAFQNCPNVVIYAWEGSPAWYWAINHGVNCMTWW